MPYIVQTEITECTFGQFLLKGIHGIALKLHRKKDMAVVVRRMKEVSSNPLTHLAIAV